MGIFRTSYLNKKLARFGTQVNVVLTGKWLFLSAATGILSGLTALLFAFALDWISHTFLSDLAGYHWPVPAGETAGKSVSFSLNQAFTVTVPWLIILLPAIGAGLAGLLTNYVAPEAKGGGTDATIKAFHYEKGKVAWHVPIVKFFASILTVGTGGSAGREGPMSQICGGLASVTASTIGLSEKERKIMLLAGMSAGIGAIFQCPIGSAMYSAEVLYKRDMETEGLMPSIISSIISYSVFSSISGWKTIFEFSAVRFEDPSELPLYILLSVFLTVIGIFYVRTINSIKINFYDKMMIHDSWKPLIGGLLIGLIATKFPAILESSYGYLQEGLNGNLPIWFMIILASAKMVTTGLTIKSGASGGIFAPTMVIGGLFGGAFGLAIDYYFPGTIADPKGFILVGMAAFFTSVEKVPIAATIMITEMSGSYELIVPLIFASSIAFIGSQNWSLYPVQLDTKLDSPTYRGEFIVEAMDRLKVRSAFKPVKKMPVLHLYDDVAKILKAFTDSELLVLPVENKEHHLVGLVSLTDLRSLLNETDNQLFVAADIMTKLYLLHLNDSLTKAFHIFKESNHPEIPVLAHGSDSVVIGTLTERNFLIAYEKGLYSD